MPRETYVWCPERQKVIPKSEANFLREARWNGIIPDIKPFKTLEGEAITSRKDLREYEKRNGVVQVGNDTMGRNDDGSFKGRRHDELRCAKEEIAQVMREL